MTARQTRKPELAIVELAVDPADVDEDTYPVRIRLTRPLTPYEAESLALSAPGLRTEGDSFVVPDARLDDIAREHATWTRRLERAKSRAQELEGAAWIADQGRHDAQVRHGSHLRSQQANDRGLH